MSRSIFAFTLALTWLAHAVGCGASLSALPDAPSAPQTRWQTPEEVIGFLPSESSEWPQGALAMDGVTIGVISFDGDQAGAPRATQSVSRLLLDESEQRGFDIVDRELLEKRLLELRSDPEFSSLSEDEILQRAMRALAADYYLVGSVAEYSSVQQSIPLKRLYLDGELDRYRREHGEFIQELGAAQTEAQTAYDEASAAMMTPVIGGFQSSKVTQAQARLDQIRELRDSVPTPEEHQNEVARDSRQEFSNVAAVGMTARLVDVATGEFLWFYDVEQRGFSLAQTVNVVSGRLVEAMVAGDPNAPSTATDALQPASQSGQ